MVRKISQKSYSIVLIVLLGFMLHIENSYAQTRIDKEKTTQELIALSKQKWQWMAEQNIQSLNNLFHEEVVFVHMEAIFDKAQELDVIKNQNIVYKNTEIQETSVRFIDNTAIVLDKIRLTAIVGGNDVVNPFMVTEVYIKIDDQWKLASLSFTRLLGE